MQHGLYTESSIAFPIFPPDSTGSNFPLAMVIDDRTDIWEAAVLGQILHVQAFIPHREAANNPGTPAGPTQIGRLNLSVQTKAGSKVLGELEKVRDVVRWVRQEFYYRLTNAVTGQVGALMAGKVPEGGRLEVVEVKEMLQVRAGGDALLWCCGTAVLRYCGAAVRLARRGVATAGVSRGSLGFW